MWHRRSAGSERGWLAVLSCAVGLVSLFAGQTPGTDDGPQTTAERDLTALIGQLRTAQGLPAVPVSRSLSRVARLHVRDLNLYRPDSGADGRGQPCNLHSWSANGPWTAVCYTDDHQYRLQMWTKPREITQVYTDNGFEIAHTDRAGATPAGAIAGWSASPAHLDVLLQRNAWAAYEWKAVGVAIEGQYAVAWFAATPDPAGGLPEPSPFPGESPSASQSPNAQASPGSRADLRLSVTAREVPPEVPVRFSLRKETAGSVDLTDAHFVIEIFDEGQWVPYFRSLRMTFGQGPTLTDGTGRSWTWDRSHDDRQHKAPEGRHYRVRLYLPRWDPEPLAAEFTLLKRQPNAADALPPR